MPITRKSAETIILFGDSFRTISPDSKFRKGGLPFFQYNKALITIIVLRSFPSHHSHNLSSILIVRYISALLLMAHR
jgi:hypothetical protein